MQTFLPYANFASSAACLDRQRLGKQRVEVLQLLKALAGETKGWRNHPACVMWREHEGALCLYGVAICREWINRGYRDTCLQKIEARLSDFSSALALSNPEWIGDAMFHASHRSNLLRKNPIWYSQFGWTEPHDLPYVWPSKIIQSAI